MNSLALASLALAALPAGMFTWNLRAFRRTPKVQRRPVGRVSVLIPARNEESTIDAVLASVLASTDIDLEVIVLDDGSEDGTAAAVQRFEVADRRVRLVIGPPLPLGWCGKQHACFVLAQHATSELLCFLDADVRLEPDALNRTVAFLDSSKAELVSGFPRLETVTFLERLLLPLIHFILLGFLPVALMRQSQHPAFAAGCGQLMVARREAYFEAGGHSALRMSLHDGLRLPRAFRSAGFATDIFDATDLARCRMYRTGAEVWSGLLKNAVEGIGAPARIGVFTALLAGGQVLPFLLCVAGVLGLVQNDVFRIAGIAAVAGLYPRVVAAVKFRQPLGFALLQPLGVTALLALQWYALFRHLLRRPSSWKGRAYRASVTEP